MKRFWTAFAVALLISCSGISGRAAAQAATLDSHYYQQALAVSPYAALADRLVRSAVVSDLGWYDECAKQFHHEAADAELAANARAATVFIPVLVLADEPAVVGVYGYEEEYHFSDSSGDFADDAYQAIFGDPRAAQASSNYEAHYGYDAYGRPLPSLSADNYEPHYGYDGQGRPLPGWSIDNELAESKSYALGYSASDDALAFDYQRVPAGPATAHVLTARLADWLAQVPQRPESIDWDALTAQVKATQLVQRTLQWASQAVAPVENVAWDEADAYSYDGYDDYGYDYEEYGYGETDYGYGSEAYDAYGEGYAENADEVQLSDASADFHRSAALLRVAQSLNQLGTTFQQWSHQLEQLAAGPVNLQSQRADAHDAR